MSSSHFCSFRDPQGIVLREHGKIFRLTEEAESLTKRLNTPFLRTLTDQGKIPKTRFLTPEERGELLTRLPIGDHSHFDVCLEHEPIFFPSYPYEWAPEMLWHAAKFTLEIASNLLPHDMGLKDATPYNILFRGPEPVFVDLLSFEERDPHDPIWRAFGQFMRMFLLPLLAHKNQHLPLQSTFLHKQDGMEPEELYRMASIYLRLHPRFFSLATLPTWLSKLAGHNPSAPYLPKRVQDKELARFTLERLFQRLSRHLERIRPDAPTTEWSTYISKQKTPDSYTKEDFLLKEKIVLGQIQRCQPKTLLDAGCNNGFFSAMAAREKATVVAIDYDPGCIGSLWQKAREEKLDILPLVVDLCRPSPSLGWKNRETLSFLERAKGAFDTVMMLALLHHMTVTARIPLQEIADLAFELTKRNLIVEFIAPEDAMFARLVRGREALYRHLTRDYFEKTFFQKFDLLSCHKVGNAHRWIYHFEKKK